jgi:hypothetical protein
MDHRVGVAVTIFAIVGAVSVVRADWTAVGSTAVVDDADVGKVELNDDGSASIRSSIATTNAKVRFNVIGVGSIEPIGDPNVDSGQVRFAMRFRDNGAGARVYAKLKRVFLGGFGGSNPSPSTVIATLDSDLVPASNGWQTITAKAADCCVGARGLSFLDHGYVVEVQLIKNDSSGTPAVLGVELFRDEP